MTAFLLFSDSPSDFTTCVLLRLQWRVVNWQTFKRWSSKDQFHWMLQLKKDKKKKTLTATQVDSLTFTEASLLNNQKGYARKNRWRTFDGFLQRALSGCEVKSRWKERRQTWRDKKKRKKHQWSFLCSQLFVISWRDESVLFISHKAQRSVLWAVKHEERRGVFGRDLRSPEVRGTEPADWVVRSSVAPPGSSSLLLFCIFASPRGLLRPCPHPGYIHKSLSQFTTI